MIVSRNGKVTANPKNYPLRGCFACCVPTRMNHIRQLPLGEKQHLAIARINELKGQALNDVLRVMRAEYEDLDHDVSPRTFLSCAFLQSRVLLPVDEVLITIYCGVDSG